MHRRGFTLIELLVVITIIIIVSAVALPTVLPALSHRQVSEGARILQAALAGARDAAIRDNAPSGIRFLPDPSLVSYLPNGLVDTTKILAYNRILPMSPAPSYSEGQIIQWRGTLPASVGSLAYGGPGTPVTPAPTWANTSTLMVVEAPITGNIGPTSWMWNIRVGEKVQINNAGRWLTVIGPAIVPPGGITIGGSFYANPEFFVNVGPAGAASPYIGSDGNPAEFLFLVDGQDDNHDGYVDNGWDGVDNDGLNGVDDIGEWIETEAWTGAMLATAQPYTISRRPIPTTNGREAMLPSNVVVDASSLGVTNERSRVPGPAFNAFTGVIEIMINPDGSVLPTTLYSSPSSVSMNGAFYHFWLAERSDVFAPVYPLVAGCAFSLPMPMSAIAQQFDPRVPATTLPYAAYVAANPVLPTLKGEFRLVSVFGDTGKISTIDNPIMNTQVAVWPFLEIQQGVQSP